jgi:DNA-directed RNA polymerase specialized sigma24 family protein
VAAGREVLEVTHEALRSLPELDQQIYSLRVLRGLTPEEIRLLVQVSLRSYRKRLERANKRVLAALLKRGIGCGTGGDQAI